MMTNKHMRYLLSLLVLAAFMENGVRYLFAQPSPACPAVDQLLDRVEKRGRTLKSVQARMTFEQEQLLLETREVRHGELYYQDQGDVVRFLMHFDDWRQIDLEEDTPAPPIKIDLDYSFDGQWFVKRDARTKMVQRWQLSRTPKDREAFRLGRGPFPLPFSIRKSDVLREFDVKLIEPDKKDPAGTDHLVLIPRPQSSYAEDYVKLELWVSRKLVIPAKLSFERKGYEVTTVTWSDIELDKKLSPKQFELTPLDASWTEEITPLPPQEDQ